MDTSGEESERSAGGKKRQLLVETSEPSVRSGLPQLVLPSSDQGHGSLPARTAGSSKRKKLTQEPPSGSPVMFSDPDGSRRGLLYPSTIAYELQVQCVDRPTRRSQGSLDLNDANGYSDIETKALELVKESCKYPLDAYYIHFRGGHCIETRDNEERPQFAIRNQMQWKSMCHKLTKAFGDSQLEHCTLLISRDYSFFELRPTDSNNEDEDEHEDAFVMNKARELRSLMKTNIHGEEYLPMIDLDGFTSQPVIRAVIKYSNRLKRLTEVRRGELIRKIDSSAKKLFTAFIQNNFTLRCLDKLLTKGYHDDNLPRRQQKGPYACCENHNDQHNALAERISAFSAFTFVALQHSLLESDCVVPILPVAVKEIHRSSDLSTRPTTAAYDGENNSSFSTAAKETRKSRSKLGEGAQAHVYLVRIDAAHNEITDNRDALFALKEFKSRGCFPEETMLTKIESYDGPHLTKRLVSWTQGHETWILFPLAECNLADYMKRFVFGGGESDTFWLLEQFIGLADALVFIHTLPSDTNQQLSPVTNRNFRRKSSEYGWHHDVKPGNILYFIDAETKKGCFQLCDYGSSKVNALRSQSDITHTMKGTPTYEPPESDEGVSRPYDTWALGCVFSILITWALLGTEGVDKFHNDRTGKRYQDRETMDDAFWEKLPEKALRKAVVDHFELLNKKATESRQHIFSKALEIINRMLDVNKGERIRMEEVRSQLQKEVAYAKGISQQNEAFSITGQAL